MERLDKDTTGMMIITDDGIFAHNILSPKKHIKKIYEVTLDIPVTNEMKVGFEKGIELNDGVCKTAKLEILGEYVLFIIEGEPPVYTLISFHIPGFPVSTHAQP